MLIQQGVKEWAGVVNAIGAGDQILLVRRYEPRSRNLLLYPTFQYYSGSKTDRPTFDKKFQSKYSQRCWNDGEAVMKRAQKECLIDINYWVHVDEVVAIENHKLWKELHSFYIWSPEHVDSYGRGSKTGSTMLWILRAYKFPETLVLGRLSGGGPPDFYKHDEEIDTKNSREVLSEKDYIERKDAILNVVKGQRVVSKR